VPDDIAIRVESVTKRFKRYRSISGRKTSFKTVAVEWLRSRRMAHYRLTDPNRFDVLRDVSFDVRRGETVGLIGRNGAGKSTLLKMIAGIYRPDAGTISVNGRVAALIELGAGFHPDFTGRENLRLNALILGLTKRQVAERFDQIVEYAEIGEFIDAPVRTYSSGMFMRLAFSVAIHVDPEVLLIDEALAVGDEAFQRKCLATIEERVRLKRQTTLIVSHDLETVGRLCDKLVLLQPPSVLVSTQPQRDILEFRHLLSTAALRSVRVHDSATIQALRIHGTVRGESPFVLGEDLTLDFDVNFMRGIREPIHGLAIRRADGVLIYGVNTARLRMATKPRAGGDSVQVSWRFRGALTPGSYFVEVAIADGQESNVLALFDRAAEFTIASSTSAIGGAELEACCTIADRSPINDPE
jgi:ABC-type polysaccharide/polyol phosphate transport system ATPase subunit